MTIGPMTCQVCHGRVWWRDAHLVMPYLGGWRKHNCKSVIAGREANPRTADRAAYGREWMRRKRAAA